MQHLNIPFSRNNQTTRRTRWVVWLLAISLSLGFIAISWISSLWFTRDTIYLAAPENTISAFRFLVGGDKGESVQSIFENIPLISNRSVAFSDLSPYISGEFALFVSNNNSRSVAIRLGRKPLPQSLLDSQSIIVQSVGHNIVLLSDKQQSIKPILLKPKVFVPFSFPWRTWIGESIETNQKTRAFIYSTNNTIEFSLKNIGSDYQVFKQIPKDSIAYLSITPLPNTKMNLLDPVLPLLQFIENKGVLSSIEHIIDTKSQIILTNDKEGIGFFITSDQAKTNNKQNTEEILKTIATLNSPKIQETLLSDNSTIKEIIADPGSISVEQITILGTEISRIHINNGNLLAGNLDDNKFFLTNREELFRSFKGQASSPSTKICFGNIGGVSLRKMSNTLIQHTNLPNDDVLLMLSQNFSSIGIKKDLFSSKMILCH